MINKMINKNKVALEGKIISEFTFDFENEKEEYYIAKIAVTRASGNVDVIRLVAKENMLNLDQSYKNKYVRVTGRFCSSYSSHTSEIKNKVDLLVKIKSIEFINEKSINPETNNNITIDGYICKPPVYRKTPLGKDITDVMIVSNTVYRSEYIPCVVWDKNALFAIDNLGMRDHVKFYGRIQSRDYVKVLEDGKEELRTAYEVSVVNVKVIDSAKGVKSNEF